MDVITPASPRDRPVKDDPIMRTFLLQLAIRRRRDVVLARQKARQVARALGFDPTEQACIAALVFQMACTVLGRGVLEFRVEDDRLAVSPVTDGAIPGPGLRLLKPLPERAREVDPTDLAWIVQEVARRAPLDLFEELQHQNTELLRALHELQAPVPAQRQDRRKPAA